jgi:FkbM family methyltransferase
MLKSKFQTLKRWYSALSGPLSFYRAIKLHNSGRQSKTRGLSTRAIRARQLSLDLHCRPGTSDFVTFLELFVKGEYAPAIDLVQPPVQSIVDLGGNVGLATAYFHRAWPEARLVLVEADPANAAIARKTLQPLIDSGVVHLHQNFIGGHERTARIIRGGTGGANELQLGEDSDSSTSDNGNVARVITMPWLLQTHQIDRIDLLKCDIEGGEEELFADCSLWIKKVRCLVAELHHGLTAQWLEEKIIRNGGTCKLLRYDEKHGEQISVAWYRCNEI